MKRNEVTLWTGKTYTINRCRACDKRILLFGLIQNNSEYDDVSYATWHQAPDIDVKLYCPYCGKKEMWIEDE